MLRRFPGRYAITTQLIGLNPVPAAEVIGASVVTEAASGAIEVMLLSFIMVLGFVFDWMEILLVFMPILFPGLAS